MRTLLFFLLVNFFVFPKCAIAQTEYPEGLSDTITPESVEVKFYKTLDSIPGDTIFQCTSPELYVIQQDDWYSTIQIAVKTKKGYNVFDGCPSETVKEFNLDTMNFNGTGKNELVVYWNSYSGRSGWIDGWNEQASGVYVWDIDKMQLIFSYQNSYEYNYWYNGVEYDSSGNYLTDSLGEILMNDSLAGGESSCDKYDVNIDQKKITIHRQADCALTNTDDGAILREDDTTWIYDITQEGLVLRKQ